MTEPIESREELMSAMKTRLRSVHVDPDEFELERIADEIEEIQSGYPLSEKVLDPPQDDE